MLIVPLVGIAKSSKPILPTCGVTASAPSANSVNVGGTICPFGGIGVFS